jgi:hypothetical protein
MVERNLSLPYSFVCFTDDTNGINSNIRCELLPDLPLTGWWYKLWFLSEEFPLDGNILFLDLDLIVFENINKLFDFSPDSFCIIRDFNRAFNRNYKKYNSSVFKYKSKKYQTIYKTFYNNYQKYTSQYHGDQEFLFQYVKKVEFWPDEWIQSYKWEMRNRNELILIDGKRNFGKQGNPKIKPTTSIAAFHGEPNIDECNDIWVQQHWH